jgi:hypothetical protein
VKRRKGGNSVVRYHGFITGFVNTVLCTCLDHLCLWTHTKKASHWLYGGIFTAHYLFKYLARVFQFKTK